MLVDPRPHPRDCDLRSADVPRRARFPAPVVVKSQLATRAFPTTSTQAIQTCSRRRRHARHALPVGTRRWASSCAASRARFWRRGRLRLGSPTLATSRRRAPRRNYKIIWCRPGSRTHLRARGDRSSSTSATAEHGPGREGGNPLERPGARIAVGPRSRPRLREDRSRRRWRNGLRRYAPRRTSGTRRRARARRLGTTGTSSAITAVSARGR